MILIGYQGIGKSTLSKKDYKYIDFESGNFFVDGKRSDDWYKIYANIARHLSEQGYCVCTSSHKTLRDELHDYKDVLIIYPSVHLKDEWIEKLKQRYEYTKLDKDYKAYKNAEDKYLENIDELSKEPHKQLILKSMNYDLKYEIERTIDRINKCIESCSECMKDAPYRCCCKLECHEHEFCRNCKGY